MTDGLEPGMYHVGREDGTVDVMPVLIHPQCIDGCPDCRLCIEAHPKHEALVEHAMNNAGWWWRRVAIPNTLPVAWIGAPMPSGMPD